MPLITAAPLQVSHKERAELERLSRSSSLPHRVVVQASALLLAANGMANEAIARECTTTPDTVRRWRAKFEEGGFEAVGSIAPGRGRKPEIDQSVIDAIVNDTLHEIPDDESTSWSTRTMAERFGVSKDTVARIWKARNLRPWRVDTFKLSNDPRFEAKLIDVVGLYLDPPERAVVFSFDEKTQCQALDRTQPSLPMKRGRAKTMTHDYKRNGTIDLFAALEHRDGRGPPPDTQAPLGQRGARVLQVDRSAHPPATSRSTSCSTTSRRTPHRRSPSGSRTRSASGGTCTSPRPARRGSTSSRAGSHSSPTAA